MYLCFPACDFLWTVILLLRQLRGKSLYIHGALSAAVRGNSDGLLCQLCGKSRHRFGNFNLLRTDFFAALAADAGGGVFFLWLGH